MAPGEAPGPLMKTSILLATIVLLGAIPIAAAISDGDVANPVSEIRTAADALVSNAECAARLAENTTNLRSGLNFQCSTNCISRPGEDAVCQTRSGLGSPSPFGAYSPFASQGPLGFQLWVPASERGGGFDAVPYLSAFDPYGSFG